MLRLVAPADAQALAAIYNEYVTRSTVSFETEPLSTEDMARRIADIAPRFPFYVWDDDGEVSGYCYVHPWKERAAYAGTLETTIYLAPKAQGRGIGTQLMQTLIADCRQRGVRALIACITAENEGSCRFHQRLGFRQVSLFEKVGQKFGRLLDVVDYELLLDTL